MTMQLIETKTLGTAAASIEFTSIPQTFTDLVVLASVRSARTGDTLDVLTLGFNGSTASRTSRDLSGDGSTASSTSYTNGRIGLVNSADSTASTFSNVAIYISNYTASVNKSASIDCVMEHNATRSFQSISAFLWSNTAAITTVTLDLDLSNFVTGSSVSLYGVLKGSGGATVS
jgi:hypothetical protein